MHSARILFLLNGLCSGVFPLVGKVGVGKGINCEECTLTPPPPTKQKRQ